MNNFIPNNLLQTLIPGIMISISITFAIYTIKQGSYITEIEKRLSNVLIVLDTYEFLRSQFDTHNQKLDRLNLEQEQMKMTVRLLSSQLEEYKLFYRDQLNLEQQQMNMAVSILSRQLEEYKLFYKDISDIQIAQINLSNKLENMQGQLNSKQQQKNMTVSILSSQLEEQKLFYRDISEIQIAQNNLSNKLEQIQSQIDLNLQLTSTVKDLSSKLDSLPTELSEQFSSMKSSILNLEADNKANKNSIKISDIYHGIGNEQNFQVDSKNPYIFQTNKPCNFTIKEKAILTAIATGNGRIASEYGNLEFLINRISVLETSDGQQAKFGQGFLKKDEWIPVNLTQEFMVEEEGTYEITLKISTNSLSPIQVSLKQIGIQVKVTNFL